MSPFLALVAMFLTSFLPILNKRMLRDASPALVAWVINAGSLPILTGGALLLSQCSLATLSCTARFPRVDLIFVLALLASVVLNWVATLLSTMALERADASLVSPLLTFNPAFTLVVAWFALAEVPGVRQTLGVLVVLLGAYLLEVQEARTRWLAPMRVLFRRPGALLAVIASALWGTTTVFEKLSIEHISPPIGPVVALLGTFLMVLLLTPGAVRSSRKETTTVRAAALAGTARPSTRGPVGGSPCRYCPALWLYGDCSWPGRICHDPVQTQFRPHYLVGLDVSGGGTGPRSAAGCLCDGSWRTPGGGLAVSVSEEAPCLWPSCIHGILRTMMGEGVHVQNLHRVLAY